MQDAAAQVAEKGFSRSLPADWGECTSSALRSIHLPRLGRRPGSPNSLVVDAIPFPKLIIDVVINGPNHASLLDGRPRHLFFADALPLGFIDPYPTVCFLDLLSFDMNDPTQSELFSLARWSKLDFSWLVDLLHYLNYHFFGFLWMSSSLLSITYLELLSLDPPLWIPRISSHQHIFFVFFVCDYISFYNDWPSISSLWPIAHGNELDFMNVLFVFLFFTIICNNILIQYIWS